MLIYTILAIFIVVPVVLHYRTFDVVKGSAESALLVGLICGLIGFWKEGWVSGVLSFFFATFFEFAIAYVVGRLYRISGSSERAEFVEIVRTTPVSEHRLLVGGLGAVAIPLTILATGIAYWWHVGTWDSIPLRHFLGWCILFIFGLAILIGLYLRKRRISGDVSQNAHH